MPTSSEDLRPRDKEKIKGFDDPTQYEPEQVLPVIKTEEEPKPAEKNISSLKEIIDRAKGLIDRISNLKDKIDARCTHLTVSSKEQQGSSLEQAMWRVFRKRSTTVTYSDYKQALEKRAQLAEEDRKATKIL